MAFLNIGSCRRITQLGIPRFHPAIAVSSSSQLEQQASSNSPRGHGKMSFQQLGRRFASSQAGGLRETLHRYRPPPLIPLGIRVIQVVAAYHFITTTIIDIRLCSGHSMLPTLSYEGDCVVCSPIPYWFPFISPAKRRPKRGDLVVADSPNSLGNTVLKRVIGVEGDIIEIEPRRGVDRKWIAEADEAYFGERPVHPGLEGRGKDSEGRPMVHGRRGEGKFIKVPKGHIWVVGDNLSNSTDSRHYGPVPLAMVKGKVLARVWPNPVSFTNPVKATNEITTAPTPVDK